MPGEGIHKDDLRSFARLVDALAPWLGASSVPNSSVGAATRL
jgi:hypothetical protein